MNYQLPLLNLVTRGHLNVKNPVAMKNFIGNLDNDSCGVILENLLFNTDSRDCSRQLDNLLEAYEFKNHIRNSIKESTLNNERDKILLREDGEDPMAEIGGSINDGKNEIIRLVKLGFSGYAIAKILRMPDAERRKIMSDIRTTNNKVYEFLIKSPLLKPILPSDFGFFGRMAKTGWTLDKSPLQKQDIQYLKKLGNFGKGVALVAAGMTTSIIAINLLYRSFFSLEARKCNKTSGKARTICMCNAVISAAEAAIKKSEEELLQCDKSQDPQECRYKLKVEIRSWMKKIEEQKRKLAKLNVNENAYPSKRPDEKTVEPVPMGTPSDPFSMDSQPENNSNPFEY